MSTNHASLQSLLSFSSESLAMKSLWSNGISSLTNEEQFFLGLILLGNFILALGVLYCFSRIWLHQWWDSLFISLYFMLGLDNFGLTRRKVNLLKSKGPYQEYKPEGINGTAIPSIFLTDEGGHIMNGHANGGYIEEKTFQKWRQKAKSRARSRSEY